MEEIALSIPLLKPLLRPKDFLKVFRLYRETGSFSFSMSIFEEGYIKSVFSFLGSGGKILFIRGQWIAMLGHQSVLLERLSGKEFHLLDSLEEMEFSGWCLKFTDTGSIVLDGPDRSLLFDSYEGVLNLQECFTDYECLNVNGKTVIDIGAYKGESSLYFWARGAQKVIALEPCRSFYEQALETVKKNKVTESVVVLNKGVGDSIREFDTNKGGDSDTLFPVNDFFALIEGLKAENSDIALKIDCEGCEYELYRDPEKVLLWKDLGVKEFIMEYHDGDVLSLLKNWRSLGYRVYRVLKKDTKVGIIYGCLA